MKTEPANPLPTLLAFARIRDEFEVNGTVQNVPRRCSRSSTYSANEEKLVDLFANPWRSRTFKINYPHILKHLHCKKLQTNISIPINKHDLGVCKL